MLVLQRYLVQCALLIWNSNMPNFRTCRVHGWDQNFSLHNKYIVNTASCIEYPLVLNACSWPSTFDTRGTHCTLGFFRNYRWLGQGLKVRSNFKSQQQTSSWQLCRTYCDIMMHFTYSVWAAYIECAGSRATFWFKWTFDACSSIHFLLIKWKVLSPAKNLVSAKIHSTSMWQKKHTLHCNFSMPSIHRSRFQDIITFKIFHNIAILFLDAMYRTFRFSSQALCSFVKHNKQRGKKTSSLEIWGWNCSFFFCVHWVPCERDSSVVQTRSSLALLLVHTMWGASPYASDLLVGMKLPRCK